MAIATDCTVAVNGDIRLSAGNYTVLELHRFLGDLADDAQASETSSDYMDISFATPSVRSTDQIITLNYPYNIDDASAEYLYGGSIQQADASGNTTLYSGLRVLGSVNSATTQIQVIQDHALYDGDAPFWGTQASPYNGGGSILMRILVKSRESGYDIDGQRIRVRAGHWGDTYASFDVELGLAESVAAISTVGDPQNDTIQGTVQGWGGGDIPTNTEGYQLIDINDDNGDQPYYSKWTYNTNNAEMKAIWEWGKDITNVGTSSTLYGMDGDLFRGITHEVAFTGQSTSFQEDEWLVWGTHIWYDNLTPGTFTRGFYVTFSGGAAGKIVWDNGVDEFIVALEDTSITIADDENIVEYDPSTGAASGDTADVDTGTGGGSAIEDNDLDGGEGWILAMVDAGATGTLWFQMVHGGAPATTIPLVGITSGGDGTANGAATARTVPSVFLGSYTGNLIGAFGVGIDQDDLSSGDSVQDLDGDTNDAPNNVTYSITGLVSGEDYLLIGKKDTSTNNFKFDEMTLSDNLTGAAETQVIVNAIPADAPGSGTLRVTLDDGRHRRIGYTSYTSNVFTVGSSDWTDPDDAATNNGAMLAFLDELATDSVNQFVLKYSADRVLWQRARDGGTAGDSQAIVTWEQQGNLGNTGGSAIVNRISDA